MCKWYHLDLGASPEELEYDKPELIERIQKDSRLIDFDYGVFCENKDLNDIIKEYGEHIECEESLYDFYIGLSFDDDYAEYRNNNPEYYIFIQGNKSKIKSTIKDECEGLTREQIESDDWNEIVLNKSIKKALIESMKKEIKTLEKELKEM